MTRTCQATGEAVLVPSRNRRSKVDRITGGPGKTVEDETVAAGSVVALKRGNARGAKGPCCTVVGVYRSADFFGTSAADFIEALPSSVRSDSVDVVAQNITAVVDEREQYRKPSVPTSLRHFAP